MTEISSEADTAWFPPSTKDVLGEHLHQKVAEVLQLHFPETKESYGETSTVSKVTGMLLEQETDAVRHLLEESHMLTLAVEQSLSSLGMDAHKQPATVHVSSSHLDYEDIGDLLYERVLQIDSCLAPQITGMLLELDVRTLLTLLSDNDQLLTSAVHKARTALRSSSPAQESSEPSQPAAQESAEPSGLSVLSTSEAESMKENPGAGDGVSLEELGATVYEQAAALYPDCASEITGMILEMDVSTLQQVSTDSQKLICAVEKAFMVWQRTSS